MHYSIATVALLAVVSGAIVWDLRERRIPNRLTAAGIVVGLGLRALSGGASLIDGVAGSVAGFAIALPLVLAGGLGGGDAKLLAAVGAFLGLGALPAALLVTALVGGALGIGAAVARGRTMETARHCGRLLARVVPGGDRSPRRTLATPGALTIPYGVAIGAGALAGWWA